MNSSYKIQITISNTTYEHHSLLFWVFNVICTSVRSFGNFRKSEFDFGGAPLLQKNLYLLFPSHLFNFFCSSPKERQYNNNSNR